MPTNELQLSDLAIEQINELFDFHENNRTGKGSDFLETLWDCLDTIQENPRR